MNKPYVQIGRVILIDQGKYKGQIATIVNIIDHSFIHVDGTGKEGSKVPRCSLPLKWIKTTPIKIPVYLNARRSTIIKAFASENVMEKFATTSLGKKVNGRVAKSKMTDFDRFKIRQAKRQVAINKRRK